MFEEYDNIVTAQEVAEMLRIGISRAYEILKTGELKAYREGRVWRIPKKAICSYVLEHSGLQ